MTISGKLALTNEDTEEGEDGENDGEDGRFRVNFEELLKINPDTVGGCGFTRNRLRLTIRWFRGRTIVFI